MTTTAQQYNFPSCTFNYLIKRSDNNTWIDLYVRFDTSRYIVTGSQPESLCVEHAQADALIYNKLLNALKEGSTDLYLTGSFDNNSKHNLNGNEMINYLERIITYLKQVGEEAKLLYKMPFTPLFSVAFEITNMNAFFEQQVMLGIKSEQAEQTIPVSPLKENGSFELFAGEFEQAFDEQYKIAVSQSQQLWIVDPAKNGVDYTLIDHLYYYAPAPLGNGAISRNLVMLYPYTGEGFPSSVKEPFNFSAINVDTWMQSLLAALQMINSSQYEEAVQLVDNEIYLKLKAYADLLAKLFAKRTVKLLDADKDGGDIVKAAEDLSQAFSADLTSVYTSKGICLQQLTELKPMGGILSAPIFIMFSEPATVSVPELNIAPALLVQQSAEISSDPVKLRDLTKWDYTFTYSAPVTSCDEVRLTLKADKAGQIQPTILKHAEPDLFDNLAQFILLYPALKTDLENYLIKSPDKPKAQAALNVLVYILDAVARSLKTWDPGSHSSPGVAQYIIKAKKYDGNKSEWKMPEGSMQVLMINQSGTQQLYPSVEGYDTYPVSGDPQAFFFCRDNGQEWMKYEDGCQLTVALKDLRVLADRDVVSPQIWIARNTSLKPDHVTNPLFVIETSPFNFPEQPLPLVLNNTQWNIATLTEDGSVQKSSIAEHLERLFKTIYTDINEGSWNIVMECRYSYPISADVPLPAEIPVFMTPNRLVNIPADYTSGFLTEVREAIEQWKGSVQPPTQKAAYNFTITISDEEMVLMKLDGLYLNVEDVIVQGRRNRI